MASALGVVHAALVAADWPRALELALAAWRDTRSPALADLVEAIAAQIPIPTEAVDAKEWLALAFAPAPAALGGLLATLMTFNPRIGLTREASLARWAPRNHNPLHALFTSRRWFHTYHERVAALLEWPDDPRIARVLTDAIVSPVHVYAQTAFEYHSVVGDRLAAIGDVRMLPRLAACIAEPRGRSDFERTLQVQIATRTRNVLAKRRPSGEPDPLVIECLAIVAPPRPPAPAPRADLTALWGEVAANPDDIGPRMVLGDALVEAGDLRGDLIVLQCNGRAPNRPMRRARTDRYDGRVKSLVRRMWNEWLGDLALVVARRGTEIRCGMIEVVNVGHYWTPPWAWAKARGHRELAAVHTVRPCWTDPAHYAGFVAALARDPRTLGIDSPTVLDELAALRPHLATRTLECTTDPMTPGSGRVARPSQWGMTGKPLIASFSRTAGLLPELTEIVLDLDPAPVAPVRELVADVVPALPRLFPKLERIAVASAMVPDPADRASVETARLVVMIER